MSGMNLHTVKSGINGKAHSISKVTRHLVNLVLGHSMNESGRIEIEAG